MTPRSQKVRPEPPTRDFGLMGVVLTPGAKAQSLLRLDGPTEVVPDTKALERRLQIEAIGLEAFDF
jgi:hypothetical protein